MSSHTTEDTMSNTRTIGSGNGMTHALIDSQSLCGTSIDKHLATRTQFAIQQWAALTSFNKGCPQCIDALKSDSTVARFAS